MAGALPPSRPHPHTDCGESMTRPLRILFITDAFPPHAYGSGWSTYHLARGLRAKGHAVNVILADPTLHVQETRYDDFPVWRASPASRRYNPATFAASGLGPGRIARAMVRRWRPDIIHAQHINSALIAHRAAAGTPIIITVRDHWPVCFYGTALVEAHCPACLHGTQTACNARRGSPRAPHIAHLLKATTMRAMLAQRGRVLRSAAGVIALSEAIAAGSQPRRRPRRDYAHPECGRSGGSRDSGHGHHRGHSGAFFPLRRKTLRPQGRGPPTRRHAGNGR